MAYSLSEQQELTKPPSRQGKKVGEVVQRSATLGNTKYYEWDGSKWNETNKNSYQEYHGGSVSYKSLASPTLSNATGSLRYPKDAAMAKESDYVLFEFYEYQPPFKGINKASTNAGSTGVAAYNESVNAEKFYKKTSQQSVVLYMPEDISTGYKANWSGKAFSNIGRDALATAGSGDLGQALANAGTTLGTGMAQAIPNLGNKIISETIGKITGEQIGQNEIFAATRGVILNPNVELLFGGIDLRNFQLNYKLVPRNQDEASIIRQIVDVFRKAMLPKFANGDEITFSGAENIQNNFIRVPNVCKVSFMRGGGLNEYVPQYKMCAITQVDVNYTPDGTYATYGDGSMVAIGLSLAFQETKLIFAEEVDKY